MEEDKEKTDDTAGDLGYRLRLIIERYWDDRG